MIQKLKSKMLALLALATLVIPLAVPALASAQVTSPITGAVCTGADTVGITDANINTANPNCTLASTDQTSTFNNIVTKVINIFSIIVGVVAVIMIVMGGFRYVTSGGDSTKVTSAKNTILYALVGLVIVALAQTIVRFVLNKTAGTV